MANDHKHNITTTASEIAEWTIYRNRSTVAGAMQTVANDVVVTIITVNIYRRFFAENRQLEKTSTVRPIGHNGHAISLSSLSLAAQTSS